MRHSIRRLIGVTMAVVLAGGVLAACKEPSPAHGNRVLMVGDSIFAGSRPTLNAALTEAGWVPVVQAQAGTAIEDWVAQMPIAIKNSLPNVVVMELGTNDCGTKPCVELGPYIDGIMRQLTFADAVLWLTVQDDTLIPKEPDRVNAAINAAEKRWHNLFIVDMGEHFHGHDEWRSDGTHPNAEGQREMAKLIVDALEPFQPTAS